MANAIDVNRLCKNLIHSHLTILALPCLKEQLSVWLVRMALIKQLP